MGFLKKITRPISRVLDKIVPNEIKPALPFLSAAAPFLAPGIMGTSMLQRALVSGGLNLGSQLAQEGSEGDFSALSLAMASGIGALSAPGTSGTTGVDKFGSIEVPYSTPGTPSAADYFSGKAAGMEPGFAKSGLGALEGTSNYLAGTGETLRNNLFSKEGLKAAMLPVGQGITDLAVAENRRAMKDYERDMADYDAEQGAANAQRAAAIRQSMEAYGFTDDEIEDAIYAAGYKTGGRVGFEFGGITDAVEAVEETPKEFLVDKLKVIVQPGQSEEMGILNAMFNDTDGVMSDERKMEFYKLYLPQLYERGEISEEVYEGMKEDIFGEGKAEGGSSGIMGIAGPEVVSKMGEKIQEGASSLSDLITDSEGNVYTVLQYIRKFGEDAFFGGQKNPELPEKFYNKLGDDYIKEMEEVKERGYKDGGLMNLGGKEMDLRGGGFVPIGKKERADDVPARLSKNEFVMTADAVRAAGGGSVNEGAKRMYETMNRLEAKV
jgi:hypothetical protein